MRPVSGARPARLLLALRRRREDRRRAALADAVRHRDELDARGVLAAGAAGQRREVVRLLLLALALGGLAADRRVDARDVGVEAAERLLDIGRDVDGQLLAVGAGRLADRAVECDVDLDAARALQV